MHFAASPGRRQRLNSGVLRGSGTRDWSSLLEPLTSELHPGWEEAALDELDRARRQGATVLTLEDESYPRLLRVASDPPWVLYVWGELRPEDVLAIAVVGSRRATRHGLEVASGIGRGLAASGFTIVSGLARGIDAAGHRRRAERRGDEWPLAFRRSGLPLRGGRRRGSGATDRRCRALARRDARGGAARHRCCVLRGAAFVRPRGGALRRSGADAGGAAGVVARAEDARHRHRKTRRGVRSSARNASGRAPGARTTGPRPAASGTPIHVGGLQILTAATIFKR